MFRKVFYFNLAEISQTGARIEVFLLRELNIETRLWDVLVDPARKIRIGNKLYFGEQDELVAEVIDNTTSRGRILRFLYDGPYPEFRRMLQAMGKTPLPKAINREVKPEDEVWYQTIFAKHEGAVVAPTAGLHFTRELMKRFEIRHQPTFEDGTLINRGNSFVIHSKVPIAGVAPGQYGVIYNTDETICLGSGVIC